MGATPANGPVGGGARQPGVRVHGRRVRQVLQGDVQPERHAHLRVAGAEELRLTLTLTLTLTPTLTLTLTIASRRGLQTP